MGYDKHTRLCVACNFQVLCGELVQKDEDIAVEIKLAYSYPSSDCIGTLVILPRLAPFAGRFNAFSYPKTFGVHTVCPRRVLLWVAKNK